AGSSSSTWWRAGALLAEAGWRVKAPDLPSHGASPRLSTPLTPGAAAARLIDDLADRPIDLVVGHGFGGAVALALQQHGPVIHSLVLEEYADGERDWPAAADAMVTAADRARRDPEAARAELRVSRPGWDEQDRKQA
ncbi:alpha/beta fold hydrolase, partial [Bradyrhizobium sp. NBAIM08]|uniref:alpha/beta fold hydrolase n=1 Tax=Bradyrhizobium sp. NBAIM08 TaxID=2793815 RepID=UPI001CD4434D